MLGGAYAVAASVAAPALRLLLIRRAMRGKEVWRRLAERRGVDRTPRPDGRLLWLHCASVGEAVSILPVLKALLPMVPNATVLLTTGTVTSAALLDVRLPEMGLQTGVIAPVCAARCAALGCALPQSLAAGCGGDGRERDLAERARGVQTPIHPDDAGQCADVGAEFRPLAARAASCQASVRWIPARDRAIRRGCRALAGAGGEGRDSSRQPQIRCLTVAGAASGTRSAARATWRAAGLAGGQHAPRRGDHRARRPCRTSQPPRAAPDDHRAAPSRTRPSDRCGRWLASGDAPRRRRGPAGL